jgi:hypothetical protein
VVDKFCTENIFGEIVVGEGAAWSVLSMWHMRAWKEIPVWNDSQLIVKMERGRRGVYLAVLYLGVYVQRVRPSYILGIALETYQFP